MIRRKDRCVFGHSHFLQRNIDKSGLFKNYTIILDSQVSLISPKFFEAVKCMEQIVELAFCKYNTLPYLNITFSNQTKQTTKVIFYCINDFIFSVTERCFELADMFQYDSIIKLDVYL